jgi:hypothetical protein
MAIEANNSTVATTRTGLNIFWNWVLKPLQIKLDTCYTMFLFSLHQETGSY